MIKKSIIICLLIILILIITSISSLGALIKNIKNENQWELEDIEILNDGCQYIDSAIDSNDVLYISYFDNDLKLLKVAYKKDKWYVDIVDSNGDVGQYSSIAIDENNVVHISYYDATNKDLKYAKKNNSNWDIFTIDSNGDIGLFSCISVDSNGFVHISYYDQTNGDLKYCYNTKNNWVFQIVQVTGDVGYANSLVLDSENIAHISFTNNLRDGLYYATNKERKWQIEKIDSECNVFASTSIAVDSNDFVHIAYFDTGTPDENWNLKYAFFDKSNWNLDIIDPDLKYFWNDWGLSICVDNLNRVHIAYYFWYKWDLKYAYKINNKWSTEFVQSQGDVGVYASIVTKSDNYPVIFYLSRSSLAIRNAEKIQYSPDPPDTPTGPVNGRPYISYLFTFKAKDFDDDKIQYCIDWDDSNDFEYSEFVNSDESVQIQHSWNQIDTYRIKYKVIDENGYESIWSDALEISIIKNKKNENNIINLISNFFYNFKFLK